MLKVLNKPYPCNKGVRDNLIISTLVGVFVVIFLFLFEPFNHLIKYSYTTIAIYGIITFVVSFSIASILPLFFPNYFNDSRWTVGKEILHMGLIILTIGVVNFFYGAPLSKDLIEGDIYTFYNFLLSISITVIIGFMPIIIVVLYNQTRLLKKYINASDTINQSKQIRPSSTDEVLFIGEGKNEELQLKIDVILFIKAESNYCEIYYLKGEETKVELLRITLMLVEETLKKFEMFIRVHRSYIVNTNNIAKVSGSAQGYKLQFNGVEALVPVSRNKSTQFKALLVD